MGLGQEAERPLLPATPAHACPAPPGEGVSFVSRTAAKAVVCQPKDRRNWSHFRRLSRLEEARGQGCFSRLHTQPSAGPTEELGSLLLGDFSRAQAREPQLWLSGGEPYIQSYPHLNSITNSGSSIIDRTFKKTLQYFCFSFLPLYSFLTFEWKV